MADNDFLQAALRAAQPAPLHAALHSLPKWRQLLVDTFTQIQHTRMQGVPVVNPQLRVSADYFIAWQDYFLGVLATPWFMNLMLLPATNNALSALRQQRIGEKQTHSFPSGPYEFIVGTEADLGRYQSCSLFSPMFEFSDQQAVEETAAAVLSELMKAENLEIIDPRPQPQAQQPYPHASEPPTPMSRRQLLTGARS